jgi:hypothetical protein
MGRRKQINCAYCDKEKLSKNEVGLNKKLIHQQIERMMCITCLAAYLETTEEDLIEMIEGFKRQDCALFG